ncbi:uncharacterized protein FIBRA_03390 [Fibroporia radiculosa]|uniref:PLP-dependent transferase n=1 Tax=Fibroporia radiculosa TaxID=599839 RepID=J4GNG3_9APHY|nr:uncharacterized protein FIBRA_03390 [Fibroporia radiculosa]CCM01340.1 predicted protein [Fibroporia radiculosa]
MSRKATTDRGYSSLNAAHERVCASFLGPKAENHTILHDKFAAIAQDILDAREAYHPEDPTFIDEAIIQSESFTDQVFKLERRLDFLSKLLAKHCIPFFSPRYNGHMVSDASLPSILGYLVGMLWNQNNVTPEASPITSHVEFLVGQQLCRLVGYSSFKDGVPHPGWGHITCDGSVANLEATWHGRYVFSRNLKFYPLSLYLAVKEGQLSFVADKFETTLCNGEKKLFSACTSWELLNLSVDEILDLPSRLVSDYGISTQFIEDAVGGYLIGNIGKDILEQRFQIQPPKMMISVANHYSWPKATSITGIGMNNLIHIDVSTSARLNISRLDEHLQECLKNKRAVYAVVSIMGTTEHGAVDPLFDILELRKKYQKVGLSFYVHVDAAWGGYFCSMLPRPRIILPLPIAFPQAPDQDDFVPMQPLTDYTIRQIIAIQNADSITNDPHKAGFAPYPAGSLCYRDERLRFMVTMTAAYINTTADTDSVGTYGVEGSKPGAAATAVWLAHHAIGLHHRGYGSLLGEAMFTSVKLYCNWATMTLDEPNLIVKTLVMLPSEQKGLPPCEVEKEERYILDNIVNKPNSEIFENPETMRKISELGPDLIVDVFACNFHIGGKVNEDVTEASFLNRRLFERFSVTKRTDDPHTRELIVGSSILEQKTYGVALDKFKERLGLKGDGDLYIMTLVAMSPFPTAHNLVKSLADTFKQAALDEIQECYARIIPVPAQHSFVMQGTDKLYLVYMSGFNIGSYRQQVILTAQLPDDVMTLYIEALKVDPAALFTLTTDTALLSDILSNGSCMVSVYTGLNTLVPGCLVARAELTNIEVVINRSIAPSSLDRTYPELMPFYLYGTEEQKHVDHMLLCAPNAQLSASVTLSLEKTLPKEAGLLSGLIAVADTTRELAMQPFNADHQPTFFAAGHTFPCTIYRDPRPVDASGPGLLTGLGDPLATGSMTLGRSIYADWTLLNQERGPALHSEHPHSKHPTVGAPELPAIFERIGIPATGAKYSITPTDIAAVLNQLVPSHPADAYGRKMSIRKGWNDEFQEELAKRGLDEL